MDTKNEKFSKLDDIVEVKEFNLINDVNTHLKLGWKLIATYKTTTAQKTQVVKYCMGWSSSSGKPGVAIKKPLKAKLSESSVQPTRVDSKVAKKYVYSFQLSRDLTKVYMQNSAA